MLLNFLYKRRGNNKHRRETVVCSRGARQRLIIGTKAMDTTDIRRRKAARDRAFEEFVYRRIFMRTGGNVREWMVLTASIKRLLLLVGTQVGPS